MQTRPATKRYRSHALLGFNYVYKPVLDDAAWRLFNSTAEYRQWCRDNLPEYLGYGELTELQRQVLDEA